MTMLGAAGLASRFPVKDYFDAHPQSFQAVSDVLTGADTAPDGNRLVDECFNPLIAGLFETIYQEVMPSRLNAQQCLVFIEELSVFARYNAQFLRRAAKSVEGAVVELAQEFRRNSLEEGGERGKLPAHFVLYSSALLSDLGIFVNGVFPRGSTQALVLLHAVMVDSHTPSTICGGYYATEGVAIDETVLLREITVRYSEIQFGKSIDQLPKLKYYYDLHLDSSGSGGMDQRDAGVEIEHQEGIAQFIRNYHLYNLDIAQICDGFLQIVNAMAAWWLDLAVLSRERA